MAILLRELTAQPQKHFFVNLVAAADADDNHFLARQPVHDLCDQVETFLRGEAGHNANHRQIRIRRRHLECFSKSCLHFALALKSCGEKRAVMYLSFSGLHSS